MISKQSATHAIEISQLLEQKNLLVTIAADSCLAPLLATSSVFITNVTNVDVPANMQYVPSADQIEQDSLIPSPMAEGPLKNSHDVEQNKLVQTLFKLLSQQKSFARNVVKPAVLHFREMVERAITTYSQEVYSQKSFVQIRPPLPLLNATLLELISEFKNEVYVPISTVFTSETCGDEQVISKLMLPDARIQEDVSQWLTQLPSDFCSTAWADLFQGRFASRIEADQCNADFALFCFLLTSSMLDEPVDGYTGSLTQWKVSIGEVYRQSAMRCLDFLTELERFHKLDTLIYRVTDREIHLIGSVFDKFVETGANVGAIYAAASSGEMIRSLNVVLERQDELLNRWRNDLLTQERTAINARSVTLKSVLFEQFEKLMCDGFAEYFPQAADLGFSAYRNDLPLVVEVRKKAIAYIEAADFTQEVDLHAVCTEMVANLLFHYSNAFQILRGIDQICSRNPNVSAGQASDMVINELIADFLVDQLVIEKLN